jgi:hypothetical protein
MRAAWQLCLIAVFVGCAPPPAAKPKLSVTSRPVAMATTLARSYDPTRDTTVLQIKPQTPAYPDSTAMLAGATFRGEEAMRLPDQVVLGVRLVGRKWRVPKCKRIEIHASGQKLGSYSAARTMQIGSGWLEEFLLAPVPYLQVYTLAISKSASFKICHVAHRLSERELALLRELLQAAKPSGSKEPPQ